MTEQPTVLVDDRGVVGVFMRVNATDDSLDFCCDHGIRSSVRVNLTVGRTGRTERQVCDGASSPSSYQVRSVWPVRAATLHRCRPTNRTQDTLVTPWPGSGRTGAASPISLHRFCRWSGDGRPGCVYAQCAAQHMRRARRVTD